MSDGRDTSDVGAIVCFVVRPDRRRRGVATFLLEEACSMLGDLGMHRVEAHPLKEPVEASARLSAAAGSYHGPLQMYLKAGFRADREKGPMLRVQRSL